MFEHDVYVTTPGGFSFPADTSEAAQRNVVDSIWSGYESQLPRAIARLISRETPLSGDLWLRTLVPFVAGLFARTVDYFEDVDEFMEALGDERRPSGEPFDHANISRVMMLQRLLAPICAARWMVLHAPPGKRMITNDRGLSRAVDRNSELPMGWAIPLDPTATLALVPRVRGPVLGASAKGEFVAAIEHYDQRETDASACNYGVAEAARELIVGASVEDVSGFEQLLEQPDPGDDEIMSGWGQLTSWSRRVHEFEWHRLASVVTNGIGADGTIDPQKVDFEALYRGGWCPPIIAPVNLPEYPTGLGVAETGLLELDMSVPDDITSSAQ
jgi:hypothetical protein